MAFAAAWLLAGCAALAPPGASMVSGRLALQVQPHEGRPAQGFTGSFELVGDARAGELRLSHALGVQVAQARWQPSEVVLTTADGERRFDDVDALAREALGQPLPLRALPDWLRGRPWADAPSTPTASGFEQLGFAIDLARWSEGLVEATRAPAPGLPGLRLRVRLAAAAA